KQLIITNVYPIASNITIIGNVSMIKKLLTAGLLMGSLLSFSHATCWAPNCYGAIGFDTKTGNRAAYVDYTSANEAWRAVVKKCPGCENSKGLTFNNGCGVLD